MQEVVFKDLGLIDYKEAWNYQEKLFNNLLHSKRDQTEKEPNHLLFCEHPNVFTLGKSGQESNLLINKQLLEKHNASFCKINRGGDITYHGPGQIVGYPIIDLELFDMGVKKYIFNIEEVIIQTLHDFDVAASRLEGAIGVWLEAGIPGKARKICAIGVRVSRYVTMHGFAFNINTDLNYYQLINPCGFIDKGVTSLEKELGREQDIEKVKSILTLNFEKIFGMNLLSG